MTAGGVTNPGEGPTFRYGGQPMAVLAEGAGFAVCEMIVPPRFAGPVPHAHHGFDEGIYIVDGGLLLTIGDGPTVEARAGSFFLAPRGVRHAFANPGASPTRVLGVWAPGPAGLAFMADVGAVIPPGGAPDPDAVAEVYRRHASELLP
jgi:mannose-6-phosphate isomerase-like protein (cupin superfamily)